MRDVSPHLRTPSAKMIRTPAHYMPSGWAHEHSCPDRLGMSLLVQDSLSLLEPTICSHIRTFILPLFKHWTQRHFLKFSFRLHNRFLAVFQRRHSRFQGDQRYFCHRERSVLFPCANPIISHPHAGRALCNGINPGRFPEVFMQANVTARSPRARPWRGAPPLRSLREVRGPPRSRASQS